MPVRDLFFKVTWLLRSSGWRTVSGNYTKLILRPVKVGMLAASGFKSVGAFCCIMFLFTIGNSGLLLFSR